MRREGPLGDDFGYTVWASAKLDVERRVMGAPVEGEDYCDAHLEMLCMRRDGENVRESTK